MMTDTPDLALRSHVRIDGIDPFSSESWADYTDRALAWIENSPRLDPAETPDALKRMVVASSCYAGLVTLVVGATLLWPV